MKHVHNAIAWAFVVVGGLALGITQRAAAQTFPADGAYEGSVCANAVSNDATADISGQSNYRDIVGSATEPALQFAEDGTFVYLRMRLADSPRGSGANCNNSNYMKSFGWGVLIDADGDFSTYEVIALLQATSSDKLELWANTVTTTINDASEPPDVLVSDYSWCTHVQVSDSTAAVTPKDTYLTFAVPIADLQKALAMVPGVMASTPLTGRFALWGGTSNNGTTLSVDHTCSVDSNGTSPTLSGSSGTGVVLGTFIEITNPGASGSTDGTTPTISGKSEPGATITLTIGTHTGTTTADASGGFTFDVPASWGLEVGKSYVLEATAEDATGHQASTTVTFTPLAEGDDTDDDTVDDTDEGADDADGDGIENYLDLDDDNDGIPTSEEGEADFDGDGIPNHLDRDSDGDGIPDVIEGGGKDKGDGTIAGFSDANDDGLDDDTASKPLPLPNTDGTDGPDYLDNDADGDGLSDVTEAGLVDDGDGHVADEIDRDGDGLHDDYPPKLPDHDDDGSADYRDADDDNDSLTTKEERPDSKDVDTDGDGTPNHYDPDDDGDGIPTKDERPDGQDVDTDDDGTSDHLDPDDDGDGIPTTDERPDGEDRDTDGDDTPDHLDADDDGDGTPTKDERPDGEDRDTDDDGTSDHLDDDDDGDGIPSRDEDGDSDGDGVPDALAPGLSGTVAGGALCSAQGPAQGGRGMFWIGVLFALALLVRRGSERRRFAFLAFFALMVLGVLGAAQPVLAQVAIDRFSPAPLASDGFALARPDVLGVRIWNAQIVLDYANDPLVYEGESGKSADEEVIIGHHLVAHATLAYGLFGRLTVFGTLPVHILMQGERRLAAGLTKADGSGLGDVAFGARFLALGSATSKLALSAEFIARLPTARLVNGDQKYSGDSVGSYEPAGVVEGRFGRVDVRGRAGFRFRQARDVGNLEVSQELTYGAGARLRVVRDLYAHAELYGTSDFGAFFDREQTPFELLAGGKVHLGSYMLGAAAGPGLVPGYGSPNLRVVATFAYAPRAKANEPAPGDMDGDGLLDPNDSCPKEPEDFDTFEDEDGCPDPDNDGDGVLDVNDRCPLAKEDADDFEDADGCAEADNDKDGLLDVGDQCPLDPEDKDGFFDEDGCPEPDNDKDGVLDADDGCPLAPGAPENKGCPKQIELTQSEILIKDKVEFATNKDLILGRSESVLGEVYRTVEANPQLKLLRIEGHTDDVGKEQKNMDLSQRRARSVARWLVKKGIAPERLEAYGCGKLRPIADNKTETGRQQNRRVEFHIMDPLAPGKQPHRSEGCVRMDVK